MTLLKKSMVAVTGRDGTLGRWDNKANAVQAEPTCYTWGDLRWFVTVAIPILSHPSKQPGILPWHFLKPLIGVAKNYNEFYNDFKHPEIIS